MDNLFFSEFLGMRRILKPSFDRKASLILALSRLVLHHLSVRSVLCQI